MAAKHVVSVSTGSSTRDKRVETILLGELIVLERRGTDGDLKKAAAMLKRLDGKVDALGLGGVVLFIQAANKRYYLREAVALAKNAPNTPTVCGAGLKATLERKVIYELNDLLNWKTKKVLMVSGLENFGMAEALSDLGADISFADIVFFLGLPIPLKSLATVDKVARLICPPLTQLPINWVYPMGEKQEKTKSDWRKKYFDDADVITGDFHLIRRYLPEDLKGKIILTQTTTETDVAMLKARGLKTLITTTPRFDGRSLGSNVIEAAFVAISGRHPLSDNDYEELIAESGIKPDVLELN